MRSDLGKRALMPADIFKLLMSKTDNLVLERSKLVLAFDNRVTRAQFTIVFSLSRVLGPFF